VEKLVLLTIHDAYGVTIIRNSSEEGAKNSLRDYVLDRWEDGDDPVVDVDAFIERYFAIDGNSYKVGQRKAS